jgi:hypothetical protein
MTRGKLKISKFQNMKTKKIQNSQNDKNKIKNFRTSKYQNKKPL